MQLRRQILFTLTGLPFAYSVLLACDLAGADEPKPAQRTRRVIYNLDGDSCMTMKRNAKEASELSLDDLRAIVGEISYEGSQVDTLLVCVNAQVMYYPTKVGTLRGTLSTPAEREKWHPHETQRFANFEKWIA